MLDLAERAALDAPVAAQAKAPSYGGQVDAVLEGMETASVTAREWFAGGQRFPYDRRAKKILAPGENGDGPDVVHVFRRIAEGAYGVAGREGATWTSFLPGWPDGSFGWAKVDKHLAGSGTEPKLYLLIPESHPAMRRR